MLIADQLRAATVNAEIKLTVRIFRLKRSVSTIRKSENSVSEHKGFPLKVGVRINGNQNLRVLDMGYTLVFLRREADAAFSFRKNVKVGLA